MACSAPGQRSLAGGRLLLGDEHRARSAGTGLDLDQALFIEHAGELAVGGEQLDALVALQELALGRVDHDAVVRFTVQVDGVLRDAAMPVAAALAGRTLAVARALLGSGQRTDEREGGGSNLLVQGSSPQLRLMLQELVVSLAKQRSTVQADKKRVYRN